MTKAKLIIEGRAFSPADFHASRTLPLFFDRPNYQELFAFLCDWFDDSPTMLLHTSGSTGEPQAFLAQKAHMRKSAEVTCQFLSLHPGDLALLCLPLSFIAGKMMVVRALVAAWICIFRHRTHRYSPIRQYLLIFRQWYRHRFILRSNNQITPLN